MFFSVNGQLISVHSDSIILALVFGISSEFVNQFLNCCQKCFKQVFELFDTKKKKHALLNFAT